MASKLQDYSVRQRPISSGRKFPEGLSGVPKQMLERSKTSLAEDFVGVTSGGTVVPGLFSLGKTGQSTRPIQDAANAFLASLDPQVRAGATFPVDSDEWRKWSNIHIFLMRHGAVLDGMDAAQRDLALGVLKTSLSPRGYRLARDIMKLNYSIGEITGKFEEYDEWLYWLSIMGTPSDDEPWGWQIDGHHVIINTLIVGDQLVMTPAFLGSEPVAVYDGKYAGTRVFEEEETAGLKLALSLSKDQRSKAVISDTVPREVFTTAYRDNFELKCEGIRYDGLAGDQQAMLLDIIGLYVNVTRPEHANVKMEEVKRHLNETYLAWMGDIEGDGVFYYRVHSPVILIEFDHLPGIALDNDYPTRDHIHTVVRTPNGNDYGKDLLRQHREQVSHSHD
ncbi:MAG: DUF3500 domain-containing protein [Chloroflexi bacterium]|nr:DUF3500 domain-containing protein [Chloroflexota bacterium]